MMRAILTAVALTGGTLALAAGGGDFEPAGANVHDLASVQRGAALFANYCHSCHSAQYMRYQRLAEDLDLNAELVEEFLIFSDLKVTDYMRAAMPAEAAGRWLGAPPPDLTLTARSRGGDWVFAFLRSFYLSDQGWNNLVLPNASMPHVMWEMQGIQRPILESVTDEFGLERTHVVELKLDQPGLLTPREFDNAMRDLVAFMIYLAEPAILKREPMGIWVLLFLSLFTFVAYLLYKEYWRDVKK